MKRTKNSPFKPGDIVHLKSHPENKMIVEKIYTILLNKIDSKIMATCVFQDPKTKRKISEDYDIVLLEKF